MKQLIVAAMAALAIVSCSKDNNDGGGNNPGGRGEPTTVSLLIKQAKSTDTRASTDWEDADAAEKAYTGATVLIFDAAENLERIYPVNDTDITAGRTKKLDITAGLKYIYVLLNIPSAGDLGLTVGMSLPSFEKTINEWVESDVATSGKFFMTNISKPDATTLIADQDNTTTVEVGRVAAKVKVRFTATAADQTGGTLSDIKYKIGSMAKKTYTVGQFNNGQLVTPFYQYNAADITAANYAVQDDFIDVAVPALTIDGDSTYILENSSSSPKEGNTTRLIVQAKFTPKVWVDGSDGSDNASPSANGDFWAVYENGILYGYANSNPVGESWFTGNFTSFKYDEGVCYYNKVWIADNSEVEASKKYCVIRNHSYRINLNRVTGVGTNDEDGDTGGNGGTDPVEASSTLQADIEILEWSAIDQNSALEGQ